MDGIKIFAEREKRTSNLYTNFKRIQAIGMKYGVEKCAIQFKEKGRRKTIEGIELLNPESIRPIRGKRKLQVRSNIGCRHHQNDNYKKQEKRVPLKNKKAS